MDSINTKVNVKRVAIYLALDLLPLSLRRQVLLVTTWTRSYSFNSLSSVSIWSYEVPPLSSVSSTRALMTGLVFFTWE